MEQGAMERRLVIKFEGTLAPEDNLSVRTLTKTLLPIQRAIDCIVYYEEYGVIRKFSTLPYELYGKADFYIGSPEINCVVIPLLRQAGREITTKIRTFLQAPYQQAEAEIESVVDLSSEVNNARSNVIHENVDVITHEDLLQGSTEREREYIEAKVISSINQSLAPVRSSNVSDDDYISLETFDDAGTTTFEFDRIRAKRFNRIATQTHLVQPVIYEGTIHGLNENNNNTTFPYIGEFRSNTTDNRHSQSLLIPSEELAIKLNSYNLTKNPIKFWASPLAKYGAFDEIRGDIALIQII